MPTGCKNTTAKNFSGSATVDDYSCVYLMKNQGNCHWFEDVVPDVNDDKSFTMSCSMIDNSANWVFFHDYIPDMYIQSRDNLFNSKSSMIYHNNKGNPGVYHDQLVKKPFFIDVVFNTDNDILLETVKWVSEYIAADSSMQQFNTLTHISVWNSNQHSGRIPLTQIATLSNLDEIRRTKGEWSFNQFRDVLTAKGVPFLLSLFDNFELDLAYADTQKSWYKKELLIDTYFCVRFEFDNSTVAKLVLHETNIQAIKSIR